MTANNHSRPARRRQWPRGLWPDDPLVGAFVARLNAPGRSPATLEASRNLRIAGLSISIVRPPDADGRWAESALGWVMALVDDRRRGDLAGARAAMRRLDALGVHVLPLAPKAAPRRAGRHD
jgi:hypothetical protein